MDEHNKMDDASQRRVGRFLKHVHRLLNTADKLGLAVDVVTVDVNPVQAGTALATLSTNHDHPDAVNFSICAQTQRLNGQGFYPAASGPVPLPVPPETN